MLQRKKAKKHQVQVAAEWNRALLFRKQPYPSQPPPTLNSSASPSPPPPALTPLAPTSFLPACCVQPQSRAHGGRPPLDSKARLGCGRLVLDEAAPGPPAEVRRPPPVEHLVQGAQSRPCRVHRLSPAPLPAAPPARAGQARARPAPGLLGLAPRRGGAVRRFVKAKGLLRGERAGRTWDGNSPPADPFSSSHFAPFKSPPVFPDPRGPPGTSLMIKALTLRRRSLGSHHSHPGSASRFGDSRLLARTTVSTLKSPGGAAIRDFYIMDTEPFLVMCAANVFSQNRNQQTAAHGPDSAYHLFTWMQRPSDLGSYLLKMAEPHDGRSLGL
ncbi:translation initiation factor IF-2-like [Choloepus didactylus]|uniref:translation initiation factor IF-2-like n=1 Tax=Choloepus didactylus TaxID=27675 RepID=UPI00189E2184|nr:translation initiation factor IF-2-like [Choloepus didactylus]